MAVFLYSKLYLKELNVMPLNMLNNNLVVRNNVTVKDNESIVPVPSHRVLDNLESITNSQKELFANLHHAFQQLRSEPDNPSLLKKCLDAHMLLINPETQGVKGG